MQASLIYTFYSYKGGVGRSMALANIAELFYQAGANVLMIDWDLEAPGLGRFFLDDYDQALAHLGLMDMLADYKRIMAQPPTRREQGEQVLPFANIEPYCFNIRGPKENEKEPRLILMTAGKQDGVHFAEYAQSVLGFDWQDFYDKWEGELFFEWLRQELQRMADVILIDSRTGVTEMGGVCTYHLSDVVLLFCTAAEQSMVGTHRMITNFKNPSLIEDRNGRPLETIIVPSRVDKKDSILVDGFQREFIDKFKEFTLPQLGSDGRQFWNLNIPYVPKYSFKESIAVQESNLASAEDIVPAFVNLGRVMIDLIRNKDERERLASAFDLTIREGFTVRPQIRSSGSPEAAKSSESPYMGLEPFDTAHAHIFFGRERLTASLVDHLRQHRFLAVVGASGSGKSSLLRAGVVPALLNEPSTRGTWIYHIITPTDHPIAILASRITPSSNLEISERDLAADMMRDPRSFATHVSKLVSSTSQSNSIQTRLLLIVDQFEELFTLCRDESERKAFVDNLLMAIEVEKQIAIVIALRAEAYAQCAKYDNLRQALEHHQRHIGPMTQEELRQIIEEPARVGGWELEPGLADLLLDDVRSEPGALPLLSHALHETWLRKNGRTLTLAGYTAAGRLHGAIASTADKVFDTLNAEQRRIARNIFLRLIAPGNDTPDTRRRVKLDELVSISSDRLAVAHVLKTLADARLITTSEDEVDLASIALIQAWPTLREWIAESRESLRIHRQLTEAGQEWERMKRDPRALYRGQRLEQALAWSDKYAGDLNSLEQDFLNASRAEQKKEMAQAEARTIRQWLILAAVLAIVMIFIGLSWFSFSQYSTAVAERERAEAESTRAVAAEETAVAERDRAEAAEEAAVAAEEAAVAAKETAQAAIINLLMTPTATAIITDSTP